MSKFIHQSVIVYLAVIVLLRMMAMPLSLLDYSLHRDFIADHLCENRSLPVMQCGGSCFLKKQLSKSSEHPDANEQKNTAKQLIVDYFEPVGHPALIQFAERILFTYPVRQEFITHDFSGSIFHPPIA